MKEERRVEAEDELPPRGRLLIGIAAAGLLSLSVLAASCSTDGTPPDSGPRGQADMTATNLAQTAVSQPAAPTEAAGARTVATQAAVSAPAAVARPARADCLAGVWESDSLNAYLRSLLTLTADRIQKVDGRMSLTIGRDGSFKQSKDKFSVSVATSQSALTMTLAGGTTARYSEPRPGTLRFSDARSDFMMSSTMDGQVVMPPTRFDDFSFASSDGTEATYQCNGDRLSFAPTVPGRTVTPIVFHRAR